MNGRDLHQLIREQQSTIRTLLRENSRLKEENRMLRETLKKVAKMWQVEVPDMIWVESEKPKLTAWAERYEQFAGLRSLLLKLVIDLCRVKGGPVSTNEVVKAFRGRHQGLYARMKNPEETLPRRLRELRQEGYLTSVKQGWFYPTDKAVKVQIPQDEKGPLERLFGSTRGV